MKVESTVVLRGLTVTVVSLLKPKPSCRREVMKHRSMQSQGELVLGLSHSVYTHTNTHC